MAKKLLEIEQNGKIYGIRVFNKIQFCYQYNSFNNEPKDLKYSLIINFNIHVLYDIQSFSTIFCRIIEL